MSDSPSPPGPLDYDRLFRDKTLSMHLLFTQRLRHLVQFLRALGAKQPGAIRANLQQS